MSAPARLPLAHLPTPIERSDALDALLGVRTFVKRDDLTGGDGGGNKLRKLEFLMAEAKRIGATTVLTCGAKQSNHARATASAAARLGMKAVLLLWTREASTGPEKAAPADALSVKGNQLLDRLLGAEIRLISLAEYKERNTHLAAQAASLRARGETPFVIPEGGSNGLGSLGYVAAMDELRTQLGESPPFDEIVVACGSGGTAAGVALGASKYGVATKVRAVCVCDDAAYFSAVARRIVDEARALDPSLVEPAPIHFDEHARGPRYGTMSTEQLSFLRDVARRTGYVTDPVYTGKALHGLAQAVKRGELSPKARVLFIHTGGLPGLLAQGPELSDVL